MFTQDPSRYQKRFEVEELEGTLPKTVHHYVAKKDELSGRVTKTRMQKKVEVPAGFMVYTAKGGSIHFWTKKDLIAAGFGSASEIIDMETGDVVPTQNYTLKELVQANEMKKSMRRVSNSNDQLDLS
jgi:hypothetical protein